MISVILSPTKSGSLGIISSRADSGIIAPTPTRQLQKSTLHGLLWKYAGESTHHFLRTKTNSTSTYADFAAMALPYDSINKKPATCNITGIATRYNATWQILIRKTSDIQVIK